MFPRKKEVTGTAPAVVPVRLVMKVSLIGEDRKDWLSGETHDASPGFAQELFARDAADLVEVTEPIRTAPDPVAVHRDPVVRPRRKRR